MIRIIQLLLITTYKNYKKAKEASHGYLLLINLKKQSNTNTVFSSGAFCIAVTQTMQI